MSSLRPLVILTLLLGCFSASAQVVITVVDENNEPLPRVEVTAYVGDSINVKSQLTNFEGELKLDLDRTEAVNVNVCPFGYTRYKATLSGQSSYTIRLNPSVEELGNVVVTGEFNGNRAQESVSEIRVITQERIEQLGSNNASEVLSRELNIRVTQDQVLGSGIEMQGVSGQNVKILVDGVPMIGRLDGNIDLSQIEANSIERIEVVNGPLSVQYGTDALGGTINIITRKSDTAKHFSVGAKAYYESVGQYNNHINLSASNQKHSFSLSGSRQYFDGWSEGDDNFTYLSEIQSDSSRFQSWKPKLQWIGRLNYDYRPSSHSSYGVSLALFDEKMTNRGNPRGAYLETAFDDIYRTKRYDISLRGDWQLSENNKLQILASNNYYLRNKNTYLRSLVNLSEELTPNNSDQDTTLFNTAMSRGNWTHTSSKKFNFTLGYDVSHEYTEGQRIETGSQQMSNAALFSVVEWKPSPLLIVRPGVRAGYNTHFSIPVIPSVQIKWGKLEEVLRVSYARGFRAPSLKELYFEFVDINHNIVGNLDLQPEDGHNVRMSYQHQRKAGNGFYQLQGSVYYNHINNMISLAQTNTGTVYSYVNIGEFQSVGSNLQASFTHAQWRTELGFAYIGRSSFQNEEERRKMLFNPEAQASLTYSISSIAMDISAFYKYNGVRLGYGVDDNNNVYETQIDDYSMLDISVSKKFFNNSLNASIGAKNLLDVTNLNATASSGAHSGGGSLPQNWGRSYFFSLAYTFQK